MSTEGKKFDQEKPDMSLLSGIALTKVAAVMTFGKKKYGANNWRAGIAYTRLIAGVLRHIFSWLSGETLDPETGISHLAHAMCGLQMLLEFETTRPDLDDRYRSNQCSTKEDSEAARFADKCINALEQGKTITFTDAGLLTKMRDSLDNEHGTGVNTYRPYTPKEQS